MDRKSFAITILAIGLLLCIGFIGYFYYLGAVQLSYEAGYNQAVYEVSSVAFENGFVDLYLFSTDTNQTYIERFYSEEKCQNACLGALNNVS